MKAANDVLIAGVLLLGCCALAVATNGAAMRGILAPKPIRSRSLGWLHAFTIIAGHLPQTPSLTFKVIQLYSDGTQAAWTQTEAPGSTADLDNPAPVLTLAPSTQISSAQASTGLKAPASTASVVLAIIAAAALGVAISNRIRTSL
jgi:Domain of unkown function (DUF1775)